MSSIPRKIVGGLLAGLLALFAAVVVATPAWADETTTVVNTQQLATSLFGSPLPSGVQVDEASKTVTVPANTTVTAASSALTLEFPAEYTLVVNGTVNVSNPITVTGREFTISGSGTVQSGATMTSSMLQVGLASGDSPTATSVTTGSLNIDGSLSVVQDDGSNYCVLMVRAGSASVDGGATINSKQDTSNPSDAGRGAIQVGSSAYAGTNVAAKCTIGEATISGFNGVNVTNSGSVVVNSGAKIDGYGNGKTGADAYGTGILALAQVNGASPSVEVNGGEISGYSRGVSAGYASDGMSSSEPGGMDPEKVSATIDVSGGTITGGNDATGGDAGIENLFSQANVDVTGGTIKGVTAFQSEATGPQVSGGDFSTPVDPTQVDPNVKAMGVMPGKGGTSSYGYFPTAADATAAGATATVPLNTASTMDILAYGIIPGEFDAGTDVAEPNPIQAALAKVGVATGSDCYTGAKTAGAENTLYVVYYTNADTPSVTAQIGTTTNPMSPGTASNGFNYATLTLDNTAGKTAGTYTLSAISGSTQVKEPVNVAGVAVYNATSESANGIKASAAQYVFCEAGSDAEAVDLPTITPKPLSASNSLVIGWYQLTPTKDPAAGAVATSFNAALYDGTTWTPSSATMTYLMGGYATLPTTGITANLAIDPTNMTNTAKAAQATLTLTLANKAVTAAGNVTLANLSAGGPTVANASSLKPTMAAVANGVANVVESTSGVTSTFNTSGNSWAETLSSASATLATTADGDPDVTVDGSTVTAVFDVNLNGVTPPANNPVVLSMDITDLGIDGKVEAGTPATTPKLTQPAATFNVFQGVAVTSYGNGTFTQTVNADGTVTLTAVPANGATFIGWQDKLGNTISTNNPWVLSKAAVQSLTGGIIAFFEGGSVTPTPPEPPTPEGSVAIYRLYNQTTGEHLLSSSSFEVAQLTSGNDWILDGYDKNPQGIAFYDLAATSDGTPIYRLYDYGTGTHLYTSNVHEKDTLASQGWHVDFEGGAMFKAPTTSNYPVYRLYNGSLPLNISHLWTASYNEFNTLKNLPESQRWTPEPSLENPVAWWATGLPTGPNV